MRVNKNSAVAKPLGAAKSKGLPKGRLPGRTHSPKSQVQSPKSQTANPWALDFGAWTPRHPHDYEGGYSHLTDQPLGVRPMLDYLSQHLVKMASDTAWEPL